MTQDEIFKMAKQAGFDGCAELTWQSVICTEELVAFANLVAQNERTKLQGQIETLHAMYELASQQRDQLMDEQRSQIAAMRGRMQ